MWILWTWVIVFTPIVLGVGAFGYIYLKEEFYKHPFFDNYEEDENQS